MCWRCFVRSEWWNVLRKFVYTYSCLRRGEGLRADPAQNGAYLRFVYSLRVHCRGVFRFTAAVRVQVDAFAFAQQTLKQRPQ